MSGLLKFLIFYFFWWQKWAAREDCKVKKEKAAYLASLYFPSPAHQEPAAGSYQPFAGSGTYNFILHCNTIRRKNTLMNPLIASCT